MALTFDSLTEDGGRQRAMSLRLPGGDVNSFGGWFPSVSLNALRRLSSTTRSEQLSTSLDKPRKRSRISLAAGPLATNLLHFQINVHMHPLTLLSTLKQLYCSTSSSSHPELRERLVGALFNGACSVIVKCLQHRNLPHAAERRISTTLIPLSFCFANIFYKLHVGRCRWLGTILFNK
ncbi:hypothetical protein T4D_12525 [Trichinella pseudospiralis]|uniref:Uncharacterized protein n=1 Tax=Trichinella pseudospiralis TaxID=6337 RepID=A0A0V1G3U4_TRIPS|nr:hypothetical protein T4D_12525 [Trichinella pseudospiralis]